VKVSAASGWFAARPSGTEDIYKILRRELLWRRSSAAHPGGSPVHRRYRAG
jgi:hypothetical protein